jgi:hypothetical protein
MDNKQSSTTFVTSFIDIQNDSQKSTIWRFEKFMQIVKSGIPLCVYVDKSPVMQHLLKQIESYTNVKIINDFSIEETLCFKTFSTFDVDSINIPEIRNQEKDIKNYMLLMNSKIDLMHRTVLSNPWNTPYFAWIDFSIFHISQNNEGFTQELVKLCNLKTNVTFLAIPGCTDPINKDDNFTRNILWRFCGGFFLGNKHSIIEFYDLQVKYFHLFIEQYKTLVWEVNFWAWLEANTDWKPHWYKADHNDSIIQIPSEYYSICLSNLKHTKKIYDYPIIGDSKNIDKEVGFFIPCSASYILFKGQHILNTRYINYTIQDKSFIFHYYHQGCGIIVTKNYMSFLDSNLTPINYEEIEDPPTSNGIMGYNGIEDIRLYNYLNEIRFIGTSMSHSTHEKDARNLIVTGKYDHNALKMTDCQMIEAPTYSRCEKNWTPVIRNINGVEKEHFIFKWSPMQIGHIIDDEEDGRKIKRLEIDTEHIVNSSIFSKFKGSTLFVNWGEVLIGVVHYSEGENLDRKYYHVLVMLDSKTLKPLKYSNSFYFGPEKGIEFCIGFAIIGMKYHFWISQNDKDPKKISVAMNSLPFSFNLL